MERLGVGESLADEMIYSLGSTIHGVSALAQQPSISVF